MVHITLCGHGYGCSFLNERDHPRGDARDYDHLHCDYLQNYHGCEHDLNERGHLFGCEHVLDDPVHFYDANVHLNCRRDVHYGRVYGCGHDVSDHDHRHVYARL